MNISSALLPDLIDAVADTIASHAEEVTALDQAIGDGDHLINLQRGLNALMAQSDELAELAWPIAWQKIGMTMMSTIGGASGSLFGTLFVAMSKAARELPLNQAGFAEIFMEAVNAVKQRGKSDIGEKTLLDVLCPVADYLQTAAAKYIDLTTMLTELDKVAIVGMEATRDMLATKGRAAFLDERSRGHIDAGAKTTQLMIAAVVEVLLAS